MLPWVAGTAQAQNITFAQFRQANSTNGLTFNSNPTTGALTGSVPVLFNFVNVPGLPTQTFTATLTINATTTQTASLLAGNKVVVQPIDQISSLTIKTASNQNLLTVDFNGSIGGGKGGTTGSLNGSVSGGNLVTFSSDFLNVTDVSQNAFSLTLTSIRNLISGHTGLQQGTNLFLDKLSTAATGTFSAASVTAVPEPATIVMLGSGLVWIPLVASVRRRRGVPKL
jgi:hypothetical protein